MPTITKKEAEKKDFVIVKDKNTSVISRIVAPHPLQIGIDGFRDCTLTVKGNECIEGSLVINHGAKGVFKLPDGTPSVKEGTGIRVTPRDDGGITISTTQEVSSLISAGRGIISAPAQNGGIILSLASNIRQVIAGDGLVSNIINDVMHLSIDRTQLLSMSGGMFTGPVVAAGGISGSLQFLQDGTTPYLVAGPGIEITTGSSGQVTISSSGSASNQDNSRIAGAVGTELVMNGTLVGSIDGLNRTFQLDAAPADTSTFMLWMNGQLLTQGSDYSVSGSCVTLVEGLSPVDGDVLRTMYSKQVSAKLYAISERPTALITSGSLMTGMQLARRPDPSSSLMLFLNGQLLTQGTENDYSLQDDSVTFNRPFLTDDVVLTTYSYAV